MRVCFETERLIIRTVLPEDAEAAFLWCGDPKVNTYMPYPLYHSAEEVRKWLEGRMNRDVDDPDVYDEGFVLKETGELIGMGGLRYHADTNAWEIGYNLRADQWGHGFVPEAIQGLIDYVSARRSVEILEGTFAAENTRSRRVLEKLGLTFYQDTEYEKMDGSRKFPAKLYRKTLK